MRGNDGGEGHLRQTTGRQPTTMDERGRRRERHAIVHGACGERQALKAETRKMWGMWCTGHRVGGRRKRQTNKQTTPQSHTTSSSGCASAPVAAAVAERENSTRQSTKADTTMAARLLAGRLAASRGWLCNGAGAEVNTCGTVFWPLATAATRRARASEPVP